MSHGIRSADLSPYRKGDILACEGCGYVFVNLRTRRPPACRRCGGGGIERWRPCGAA